MDRWIIVDPYGNIVSAHPEALQALQAFKPCPECDGTGEVSHGVRRGYGWIEPSGVEPCPMCTEEVMPIRDLVAKIEGGGE